MALKLFLLRWTSVTKRLRSSTTRISPNGIGHLL
jgi:hypothetical protein